MRGKSSSEHINLEDALILVRFRVAEPAHNDNTAQGKENKQIKDAHPFVFRYTSSIRPRRSMPLAQQALGIIRALVGILTWLLPYQSARIFGLRRPDEVQILAWRLFASREMAFAFFALSSLTPETTKLILQAGVIIDSLDAVATLIAYNRSSISTYAGVMVGIGALFFAVLGAVSLQDY
jgi:hypothetical protein